MFSKLEHLLENHNLENLLTELSELGGESLMRSVLR